MAKRATTGNASVTWLYHRRASAVTTGWNRMRLRGLLRIAYANGIGGDHFDRGGGSPHTSPSCPQNFSQDAANKAPGCVTGRGASLEAGQACAAKERAITQ